MRNKIASLGSLLLVLTFAFGGQVLAATAKSTAKSAPQPNSANGAASDNGLKVSPVRTDIAVDAGTTKVIQVTATNVTPSVSSYQVVVNDFTAGSDESGQPQILLDVDKFAASHSLKRLIGNLPTITLQPGESKNVSIPITVPKDYAAGGYYGAIRFAPHSSDGAANKNVTLSASVGSLVLVTVPGNYTEQVGVASLDARKAVGANEVDTPRVIFTDNKNINAVIRFQNGGDIQEQPFGKVTLKNWRGTALASYEVNNGTPRGNVLPDSIRKFDVALTKLGSFGKYTLEGNFGYGSSGQLITARSSFYIIPLWFVILVAAIVAAILFVIFGLPRLVSRYNRRVVSSSMRKRGR